MSGSGLGRSSGVTKLWVALEYGDAKTVRSLLVNGVNVNHVFKEPGHRRHGQTPVFIAVAKNNRELLSLLLTWGANLNHADIWGESPIYVAVRRGKLPMVKHLISLGCNINQRNKRGENVLFLAIKWGRLDLVDSVIAAGVDVDVVNMDGFTPVLLSLDLFSNSCTSMKRSTRQSAPSNMEEIIERLIPVSKNLAFHHSARGSALQISVHLETMNSPSRLHLSKQLMQHGCVPDRNFFLRFGGLQASTSPPQAEFFTDTLIQLALHAGASLQRERIWMQTVLTEMPGELWPYEALFRDLLEQAQSPHSLTSLCVLKIRRHLLSQGGPLWKLIEVLPLPNTLKNTLKLVHCS